MKGKSANRTEKTKEELRSELLKKYNPLHFNSAPQGLQIDTEINVDSTLPHIRYLPELSHQIPVFKIDDQIHLAYINGKKMRDITIYNLGTREIQTTLKGFHDNEIYVLKYYESPFKEEDKYLISSSLYGKVNVFIINSNIRIKTSFSIGQCFKCEISMIFKENSPNKILSSNDKFSENISIINDKGNIEDSIELNNGKDLNYGEIRDIETYYAENETFALISTKIGIILYDLLAKHIKFVYSHSFETIYYCSYIHKVNDIFILFSGYSGGIDAWNLKTGELIPSYSFSIRASISSLCFWNKNFLLYFYDYIVQGIWIFDIETGKKVKKLPTKENVKSLKKIITSEGDEQLISINRFGNICLWSSSLDDY